MRLPLIEDLINGPVPPGSNFLVEYDARSQWFDVSFTIAAGWLKAGGAVSYAVFAQPPDSVRLNLTRIGIDVKQLETNEKLQILDVYTPSLGRKSKEKLAAESLKVADLSIEWSRETARRRPDSTLLRIGDDLSSLDRFNDEKAWVEFLLTRIIPIASHWNSTGIGGILRGVHSEWVYRRLESVVDGVIDIKLEEVGQETKNVIRIVRMRNVPFDSRWHPLKIRENFQVTLER